MSFDLSDYVDVAERIRIFKEKYPEGVLQSEVSFIDGGVLCKAYAYRVDGDPTPGIGHAFEPIPGSTPYTRDSEVMNAETSAWGRAIAALGFDFKKIASAEEVRNRSAGEATESASEPTVASPAEPNPAQKAQAAAEAAKAARTPTDDGKPENVEITFGKHRGKTLGEVPSGYLEWLVGNFEARNEEQRRIVAAAGILIGAGLPPLPVDDDIPFAPVPV